jgi:5'-phosphate synthase pdxT subunit
VVGGAADGRIVAVRQGNLVATSFHPELTGDRRVHALFVDVVRRRLAEHTGASPGSTAGNEKGSVP